MPDPVGVSTHRSPLNAATRLYNAWLEQPNPQTAAQMEAAIKHAQRDLADLGVPK